MLDYYSQFDVLTPNGLRKWQHYAIEQAAGQVTAMQNQNALTLGKNVQLELESM